jgi:tetratricopeptide (TPR) repeat protein
LIRNLDDKIFEDKIIKPPLTPLTPPPEDLKRIASTWLDKGYSLSEKGKYFESIECFDKAIEIDPTNAAIWFQKGYSLAKIGKYREAIECFDKAIEIDPTNAVIWRNKGHSLDRIGLNYESKICYNQAKKLETKS